MAKLDIDIGTVANDGTGDQLRTAFDKTNLNFTVVYSGDAPVVRITAPATIKGVSGDTNGMIAFDNANTTLYMCHTSWTDGNADIWYSIDFSGIGTNTTNISANDGDIAAHATLINDNTTDIGVNTTAIGDNAAAIGLNTTNITGNDNDIIAIQSDITDINAGIGTVANATIPTLPHGVAGDLAGQIAYADGFLYVCILDYVNDSTISWQRVAITAATAGGW